MAAHAEANRESHRWTQLAPTLIDVLVPNRAMSIQLRGPLQCLAQRGERATDPRGRDRIQDDKGGLVGCIANDQDVAGLRRSSHLNTPKECRLLETTAGEAAASNSVSNGAPENCSVADSCHPIAARLCGCVCLTTEPVCSSPLWSFTAPVCPQRDGGHESVGARTSRYSALRPSSRVQGSKVCTVIRKSW